MRSACSCLTSQIDDSREYAVYCESRKMPIGQRIAFKFHGLQIEAALCIAGRMRRGANA